MPIIQMNMIPVPVDMNVETLNVMSDTLLERLESESLDAFVSYKCIGIYGDLPQIRKIWK